MSDVITLNGASILSMNPGVYELSSEMQKVACLLDDGRLLVSKSHLNDPHINSYQNRLHHQKFIYQVVPCDVEQISKLYAAMLGVDKATNFEQKAIDLFMRAASRKAAEIRIRVNRDHMDVWFRVKQDMVEVYQDSRDYGMRLCSAIYGSLADTESIAGNPFSERERQSASLSTPAHLGSERLDSMRLETAPTREGFVMNLRLLYKGAETLSIESLGWDSYHIEMLHEFMLLPSSMFFMSGPTGSGKTTSLVAICKKIIADNNKSINLVTIEDPAEIPIPDGVQTVIKKQADEALKLKEYNQAIAGALRLDPDVLMIGEIRELSAAKTAFTAALTGHPVWTSVHANSAYDIITRLLDIGVSVHLVTDPSVVAGLMAQRLVKTLCPHCKIPLVGNEASLKEDQLTRVKQSVGDLNKVFILGPGCDHCNHDGVAGETAIIEIINTDSKFMAFARNGQKEDAISYWRQHLQGRDLMDHAIRKIWGGEVDPRHAEKAVGPLEDRRRSV